MAQTVIEDGLKNVNEIWGVEIPLYFPQMYAGTTDGCGIHMGDESILDYKQTNKPKKREWIEDYFVQLSAYANAHNEVHGTKIRKGVIFMCSADNLYQEFILEGSDFDKYTDIWFKRVEQYYMSFL
jgi:genome maintenance exonuclease 1